MIQQLTLANFRCWRELRLGLKPITILFGQNSSGKTAVLDTLLMLKQTSESSDRGRSLCYTGYRDLGSFRDVIHANDESRELSVELRWRPRKPAVLRDPAAGEGGPRVTSPWVNYRGEWAQAGDVALTELGYQGKGVSFKLARAPDGRYEPGLESDYEVVLKRRRGKPWPLPSPESCYALPRQVARDWPHVDLLEFNHQFELLMGRLRHLGPLRNYPERDYLWTGEAPTAIAKDGGGAIEALLAYARRGPEPSRRKSRAAPRDVLDWSAHWLRRFGLATQFGLEAIGPGRRHYEVLVRAADTQTRTLLPDVGFGVSQVLPVIVQLYFVPEGSILLFEQPEIHLHPRAAALLADLFLEAAYQRDLQVIIETHSEYLLTRLQRHIAEAALPMAHPDHVALYFCELADGESTISPVGVNVLGEIENWPEGFFGDAIGDLKAMTQAKLRRQTQGGQ